VALLRKKSPEERAEEEALKEQQRAANERRRHVEQLEKARREFFESPVGQARTAFERGDLLFQFSIDVMNQKAIIAPMMGGTTTQKTSDPVAILNAVCREGWDLTSGSFVFVEQGQESRDKFTSSGQNVAIKGQTVGYYLFKRCESNRVESKKPWESAAED
jgi:hypothetical protein